MDLIRRTPTLNNHSMVSGLNNLKARLAQSELEASSGLKITKPSDAPELWTNLHNMGAKSEDMETYVENADSARFVLATAEGALRNVTDLLIRVKERVVMMTNEAYDAETRQNTALEIAEMREELVMLANTSADDRHVFSGAMYNSEAFDATGTYQGDTGTPRTQIGAGHYVTVGMDGSQVFQGTVDAFQVLDDVATAMAANDVTALSATLGDVSSAIDQSVNNTEIIGARWAKADDAEAVARSLHAIIGNRVDNLISADPIETYTRLADQRASYEAALSVTGSTSSQSLYNYLR